VSFFPSSESQFLERISGRLNSRVLKAPPPLHLPCHLLYKSSETVSSPIQQNKFIIFLKAYAKAAVRFLEGSPCSVVVDIGIVFEA